MVNWDLKAFSEVARDLSAISDATFKQVDIARDARNLIHPGKMIRERAECHRGTAFAAAAAIDHVIRDLEKPDRIKPVEKP